MIKKLPQPEGGVIVSNVYGIALKLNEVITELNSLDSLVRQVVEMQQASDIQLEMSQTYGEQVDTEKTIEKLCTTHEYEVRWCDDCQEKNEEE